MTELRYQRCAEIERASRRFPPRWTVEELNNARFIVRDKNGQALGYFYFEDDPGRRTAASLLTREGAAHALNIASCRSC